jgi:hypothetical protein
MRKFIYSIIFVSFMIFLFCGCSNSNKTSSADDKTLIKFKSEIARTNGYVENRKYPIITNCETLQNLQKYYNDNKDTYDFNYSGSFKSFNQLYSKYDNGFFINNSLILIALEEGSGSIRHSISKVTVDANKLTVYIDRLYGNGVHTADMAEWHIFIETGKENLKNISSIECVFNNIK